MLEFPQGGSAYQGRGGAQQISAIATDDLLRAAVLGICSAANCLEQKLKSPMQVR